MTLRALACCLLLTTATQAADNVDPDGDGSRYAWGENIGWVSGKGTSGVFVQNFRLTGYMWSENAGWISLNCENDGSCGSSDYGVLNDGLGTLSGLGWSENAGWIDFAPATAGVTIDAATGEFQGRAWAENVGWISFGGFEGSMKTSWCETFSGPPAIPPELVVVKDGTDAIAKWGVEAEHGWYDVVGGSLETLRDNDGSFSAGTSLCVDDDVLGKEALVDFVPAPGSAIWFIVRPVNCRGLGSYDTSFPTQSSPRDAGITASGNDCP